MKKNLFDHRRRHVGTVTFVKKNSTAFASFFTDNHYANITMPIEEFEGYKHRFGFMLEEDLKQINFDDLMEWQ